MVKIEDMDSDYGGVQKPFLKNYKKKNKKKIIHTYMYDLYAFYIYTYSRGVLPEFTKS